MAATVPVDYLFNRTCPSHEQGLRLLDEAAERAGVTIAVRRREVRSDDEARRLGFFGSPAYVVAGRDIAEPPAGVPARAEACRAYRHRDGRVAPLPDIADLAAALRAAADRSRPTQEIA